MKKTELQKPIKSVIERYGFKRVKGDFFAMIANDSSTKFCLRIPDGKRGFVLGVQFPDFGLYDGVESHSVMRQFDHAYDLAYGNIKDYAAEEIESVTEQVCLEYRSYFLYGADEIKRRVDTWTFGDLDRSIRNELLRYLGQPVTDPYSEQHFQESLAYFSHNGGMMILPEREYNDHKDFYDRYAACDAKIEVKRERHQVYIIFSEARKWWQK